jgi:hypothetical protein
MGTLKSLKEWMLDHKGEWIKLKGERVPKVLEATGWDFVDVVMGAEAGARSLTGSMI